MPSSTEGEKDYGRLDSDSMLVCSRAKVSLLCVGIVAAATVGGPIREFCTADPAFLVAAPSRGRWSSRWAPPSASGVERATNTGGTCTQLCASKKKRGEEKARDVAAEELRLTKMRGELVLRLQDALEGSKKNKAAGVARTVRKLLRSADHDGLKDIGDEARILAVRCLAAAGSYGEAAPLVAGMESSTMDDLDMAQIGLKAYVEAEKWGAASRYADSLYASQNTTAHDADGDPELMRLAVQSYGNAGRNLDVAVELLEKLANTGVLTADDANVVIEALIQAKRYDVARQVYRMNAGIEVDGEMHRLGLTIASKLADPHLANDALNSLKRSEQATPADIANAMESLCSLFSEGTNADKDFAFASGLVLIDDLATFDLKNSLGNAANKLPKAFFSHMLENIKDSNSTDAALSIIGASKLAKGGSIAWPNWLSSAARMKAIPVIEKIRGRDPLQAFFSQMLENIEDSNSTEVALEHIEASKMANGGSIEWPSWISSGAIPILEMIQGPDPVRDDARKILASLDLDPNNLMAYAGPSDEFWSAALRLCAINCTEPQLFPLANAIVNETWIHIDIDQVTMLAQLDRILLNAEARITNIEASAGRQVAEEAMNRVNNLFLLANKQGNDCSMYVFLIGASIQMTLMGLGGLRDDINEYYAQLLEREELSDRELFGLMSSRYFALMTAHATNGNLVGLVAMMVPPDMAKMVFGPDLGGGVLKSLTFVNNALDRLLVTGEERQMLQNVMDMATRCDEARGCNDCIDDFVESYHRFILNLWRSYGPVAFEVRYASADFEVGSLEDALWGERSRRLVLDMLRKGDVVKSWMDKYGCYAEMCGKFIVSLYATPFFKPKNIEHEYRLVRKACVAKIVDELFAACVEIIREEDAKFQNKKESGWMRAYLWTEVGTSVYNLLSKEIPPSALFHRLCDDNQDVRDIIYEALLDQPIVKTINKHKLNELFMKRLDDMDAYRDDKPTARLEM